MIESSDSDVPKIKVSRNCVMKLLDHSQRGFKFFFPKLYPLPYFLIFFVFFFNFLDFSLLFHLLILVKKLWKLLWLFFCMYWRFIKAILENFEFFFSNFYFKKQPYYVSCWASNRRHRVKHHVDDLHHVDCLTDVIFNVSWVNFDLGPNNKSLS